VFDRLLALTVALTLVAGTIAQPPCCCKSPTGACRVEARATSAASCCAIDKKLPPCCRDEAAGVESGPCKCNGCLTKRPKSPLNESASTLRTASLDDLPPALSAGPMDPPLDFSLGESQRILLESLSLDRPPPDRQALLCVWVI